MKHLQIYFLVAYLATNPAFAFCHCLYQTNRDNVVACKSARALYALNYVASDRGGTNSLPDGCQVLHKGVEFETIEDVDVFPLKIDSDGDLFVAQRGKFSDDREQIHFLYLLQQDMEPVLNSAGKITELDSDDHIIEAGCSAEHGGEIQRLVEGPNGQLYLKRFMVTSKCVHGQMRVYTQKLN